MPSMGFTYVVTSAFRDLSSVERAAAGPPRVFLSGAGFSRCDRKTRPPPAGHMRRLDESAHHHRRHGRQREVGHYPPRHHDRTRLCSSLGLLGVHTTSFGGTVFFIVTRRQFLANAWQHRYRPGEPERQFLAYSVADPVGDAEPFPQPVTKPVPHRRPGHWRRWHGRIPGRPAARPRRDGGAGRRREPGLPPKNRQKPLISGPSAGGRAGPAPPSWSPWITAVPLAAPCHGGFPADRAGSAPGRHRAAGTWSQNDVFTNL
jgi:hypothetical protein